MVAFGTVGPTVRPAAQLHHVVHPSLLPPPPLLIARRPLATGVLVSMCGCVPPALSPCARAGLCTHRPSPRDAKDGDAVADRVTLGGAACAGTMHRRRWRGLRGPLGDGWLLCGAAVVAVCGVWARACARVVGGVCLAIARRHVSVVVIIKTREALQIREWVDPSVDTNGRRGESAVVRCGWSSAVCWGPARMLVYIVGRLCWVQFRAKERVGPRDCILQSGVSRE